MRLAIGTLADPVWPEGVSIRTFQPADASAWLALNARAFASHPEQGQWNAADLAMRTAEPWFDPAVFFLAQRENQLVGFHWTKVHDSHADAPALGEVYVVGVDPTAQGEGLGRALTLVGLHHLKALGLHEVLLYVDADNTPAIAVYERLGFTHKETDVCFSR
jgi:mycothiol synthase